MLINRQYLIATNLYNERTICGILDSPKNIFPLNPFLLRKRELIKTYRRVMT